MPYKVYLAPSNQTNNLYWGGDTNEAVVCQDIAKRVERELKANGLEVTTGKHAQSLAEKATEAKKLNCDIYVAIHSNAAGAAGKGKARGTEVWFYTGSKEGKKLAQAVYDPVEALVGNGRGLKSNKTYQDLKNPVMPSIILEIAFHDNKQDAAFVLEHKTAISNAIAEGICKYFGMKYKGTSPASPGTAAGSATSKDSQDNKDGLKARFKVKLKDSLNLRTGPGTEFEKIGLVKEGTTQTIYDTDQQEKWGFNGQGWHSITDKYVSKV